MSDELFDRLKGTSDKSLKTNVTRTDGLNKTDAANRQRLNEVQSQEFKSRVWNRFLAFLACLVFIGVAILTIGFLCLLWLWIERDVIPDPDKLEAFLKQVWNVGLVSLATLAISNLKMK